MLKIAIASDHRGLKIKNRLIQSLQASGYQLLDQGTDSDQPVDYPDYARIVAEKVSKGEAERGFSSAGQELECPLLLTNLKVFERHPVTMKSW